ncbi:MAG: trypsin-like serine protease [Chitinivibrionales bacterium]|nr:trypsin-like serine protease [Chitinivibrionales bacterium]MBD3395965.1 trypsin-like serine protease [Chitinivibrionales bacterium]
MKTGTRTAIYLLLVVIGILIGVIAGGELVRHLYRRRASGETPAGAAPVPVVPLAAAKSDTGDVQARIAVSRRSAIVAATEKVSPCVVGIVVTQLQVVGSSYYYEDFFDLFFAPKLVPRYREVENMGSGFIIDKDGIILTNNHVVEGAKRLHINFPDGRQVEGRVVGRDPYSDLAVIAAKGERFPSVTFGDSDELLIGEWVIAIGNPFLNFFNDPRPTVTVGVISALNRNFAPNEDVYYQGMIQTDAAINPGNSGGPLIDAHGQVVGINTFIYTGSRRNRGSIGIGFAIPANRAKRVVRELLKYGRRRQVWTGITVQDIDRAIALTLGVKDINGVVITDIQRGSPGAAAGLKNGDVIVAMGDRKVRTHADLEGFFLDYFVGDTVRMRIVRNGRRLARDLTLREHRRRR